ncbi:MAG: PAS domain-containing protein [Firmicutes bacterium]|nr:PAS domain-containing protein [Bacillota bacterium]
MLGEYIKDIEKINERADAILVCNKEGIVEYAATRSEESDCLSKDRFIGKHILKVYPELNEANSSHYRVLKSGTPIINEKQSLMDMYGDHYTYINSTFPIKSGGEVVGTLEVSTILSKNRKTYNKKRTPGKTPSNHQLYTLENIITCNPQLIEIKERIRNFSGSDACALIWGETGTGKELIAESFHTSSQR